MPQPAFLLASLPLQFRVAEHVLLSLLGSEDIRLLNLEAGLPGEVQEGGELERILMVMEPAVQFRVLPGMGQKGIEALEAHRIRACDPSRSSRSTPPVRFSGPADDPTSGTPA
jgi:hypothetical protein